MGVVHEKDYFIDPTDRVRTVGWEGLAPGDTGQPIEVCKWPDASIHIYHTSGAGIPTTMQASNDPRANPNHPDHASANWITMEDNGGALVETTTELLKQRVTNGWWMRPSCAAVGAGFVNVGINMVKAHS